MMEYKGYRSTVIFDAEAGVFHGEVMGTRDVVTFQGTAVDELVQAFHDSVDEYLSFCKERGKEPDKPFSGKFALRFSDAEQHRKVASAAAASGVSLNAWIIDAIQRAEEELR